MNPDEVHGESSGRFVVLAQDATENGKYLCSVHAGGDTLEDASAEAVKRTGHYQTRCIIDLDAPGIDTAFTYAHVTVSFGGHPLGALAALSTK